MRLDKFLEDDHISEVEEMPQESKPDCAPVIREDSGVLDESLFMASPGLAELSRLKDFLIDAVDENRDAS